MQRHRSVASNFEQVIEKIFAKISNHLLILQMY